MPIIQDRFRVRRGTADAMTAANEVPLDSEIVLETDTRRAKIGDGTTHYNDLAYSLIGVIDLSTLADGDVLLWDAATNQWTTGPAGGGGGSGTGDETLTWLGL